MLGADCALIAFASPEGVVGIAHAGGRVSARRHRGDGRRALRVLGATEITAACSPMIHPECYEFSSADLDAVVATLGEGVRGHTSAGRPALDLPAGVTQALHRAGVTQAKSPRWLYRVRGRLVLLPGSKRPGPARPGSVGATMSVERSDAASPDGESFDAEVIKTRLAALRGSHRARPGEIRERVRILAVAKTFPVEAIRAAALAGVVDFGENYADELVAKAASSCETIPGLRWHFIGSIQRNKLARLAPFTAVYETLRRIEEGRDIARRSPGAAVLVEVEATGTPRSLGCRAGRRRSTGLRAGTLDLDVRGLMTVAAPGAGDAARAVSAVGGLARALGLAECSMGMSDDFELAVAAGSTEIRVGTALFGPRGQSKVSATMANGGDRCPRS